MDKEIIGQRIKLLREKNGMTQEDLVRSARKYAPKDKKLPRNMISRYEHGLVYPDAWVMQSIARALGTSAQYLMGETADPSPTVRPALTPEPVFWAVVRELNSQPPHLQRLAARLIEVALEYAREYSVIAIAQTPEMLTEDAQRARELANWLDKPIDEEALRILLESRAHRDAALNALDSVELNHEAPDSAGDNGQSGGE